MNNKQKILIVDDSEMNRSILADILEDKYDIIETEDGVEGVAAIQKYGTEISVPYFWIAATPSTPSSVSIISYLSSSMSARIERFISESSTIRIFCLLFMATTLPLPH